MTNLPEDRFLNRELTWLEFNQRVLELAKQPQLPVLERAKFLAISTGNLDEFWMVRVGGLRMLVDAGRPGRDPAGLTANEQIDQICARYRAMTEEQYTLLNQLQALMADQQIRHLRAMDCDERTRMVIQHFFEDEVFATLAPHTLEATKPFPLVKGLTMYLCVRLKPLPDAADRSAVPTPTPESMSDEPASASRQTEHAVLARLAESETRADPSAASSALSLHPESDFAIIPIGRTLPRVISLPAERGYAYTLIEDVIAHHIDAFFPGREVLECVPFRVTRNADVQLREERASDLMEGMEEVLESRRLSGCVRLEIDAAASFNTTTFLKASLRVPAEAIFPFEGPLDLTYLFRIAGSDGFDHLRDVAWTAQPHPQIDPSTPIFDDIDRGDILLIHPYDSYDPVVRMIEEAAGDDDVLAIKQVLYRTSRNSPIVNALMRAARDGKHVTAIVELKARFDEARNIEWAREMERAGIHVIYGVKRLKTHAKVCVIVRRTSNGITRYVHFGTGNYNESTAKLYSDVSLLTSNPEFGADATSFFNAVTGASNPRSLQHLSFAPLTLRQRLLDHIAAERRRCLEGQPATITAKLNALIDPTIIDALYRASQAGVKVLLNVRGSC
ncbi:MAG: polyphosphate kinase 1, partial [Planctomycetota bacterium]